VSFAWEKVQTAIKVEESKQPPSPEEFNAELDAAFKAQQSDRRRRIAENRHRRQPEAAKTMRSMRSFTLKRAELLDWSKKYDPADLAPEDWKLFPRLRRGVPRLHRQGRPAAGRGTPACGVIDYRIQVASMEARACSTS
jgi:hypothetical protein